MPVTFNLLMAVFRPFYFVLTYRRFISVLRCSGKYFRKQKREINRNQTNKLISTQFLICTGDSRNNTRPAKVVVVANSKQKVFSWTQQVVKYTTKIFGYDYTLFWGETQGEETQRRARKVSHPNHKGLLMILYPEKANWRKTITVTIYLLLFLILDP